MGGLIILNNQNEFKNIADELMEDITVSDELKKKTLASFKRRRNRSSRPLLLPAACMLLIILAISVWRFPSESQSSRHEISKNNAGNPSIMLAPENSDVPLSSDDKSVPPSGPIVSKDIKTLNAAKEYINIAVLEPSYLPKGFQLKEIHGVSNDDSKIKSIFVQYTSKDKIFLLSVEQNREWKNFDGYKAVKINESMGYIRSFKDNPNESTELRWVIDKNLYSIEGAISEDTAIKIAKSLK
ncbi:DUF4367 domain-containing protein [Clostridium bovifaecis]|uniref:DUF4367 domain-containing protein n=1 Tax=Clostridium bovifaecis TaxID=2184719 RepID=A0A6I6F626_9CLOT|nr:DUF4367 domain-containing protein [Clostridium bovifaecis]